MESVRRVHYLRIEDVELPGIIAFESVKYILFTFFSDQLLEMLHDLVSSRHYGFNFILAEIMLGSCSQLVCIESLQPF